jgi:hypothetical protein
VAGRVGGAYSGGEVVVELGVQRGEGVDVVAGAVFAHAAGPAVEFVVVEEAGAVGAAGFGFLLGEGGRGRGHGGGLPWLCMSYEPIVTPCDPRC